MLPTKKTASLFVLIIATSLVTSYMGTKIMDLKYGNIPLPTSNLLTRLLSHSPSSSSKDIPAVLGTSDSSVLGSSAPSTDFVFNVNVPANFKDTATFEKAIVGTNLTAPNVIYSLTAGTGIGLTTGQTPTITNTGVTSLQGSTGDLTLAAGSGISISGMTITNSAPGSDQKIFKTIKVGSTTFDAGSNTDTLEFAAGTGITLASDTTNKKLTITGINPGVSHSGTYTYMTTTTDNFGIGTTTPAYTLDVAGTLQVTGSGFTGLRLPSGASLNYVLTTDGQGNASWTNPNGSGSSFGGWTLTGSTLYPNLTSYNVVLGSNNVLDSVAKMVNTGSTLYKATDIANLPSGGAIGTAANTVDIYTTFNIDQTTASQTITLPTPTSSTYAGRLVFLANTGTVPFSFLGSTVIAGTTTQAMWNGTAWTLAGSNGGLPTGTVNNSVMRWNSATSQWLENTNFLVDTSGNITAGTYNGLTVSPTTGTLTIPNGKTVSFADAFTTSGAFPITLTATGATTLTLPTTGTLATLAGTETFSNKTFSGITYFPSGIWDTSGNVGIGSTSSPTALLQLSSNSTGVDLFSVLSGGSEVLGVSDTAITASLPTNFTAAGDVAINYDLNFTNTTNSNITSIAPLVLAAGEIFNSSDLTLRTYNSGNVVIDSQALLVNQAATVSGQLAVGTGNPNSANIGNFYLTNDSTYGKALAILNQTESQDVLTASSSGTTRFTIQSGGNVGIGATTPAALLDVQGTAWLRGSATNGLFVGSSGNVGIGTTSPVSTLFVRGTSEFGYSDTNGSPLILTAGGSSNATVGRFTVTSNAGVQFTVDDNGSPTNTLTLGTKGGSVFIDYSGNVGIGTTAPTALLDVAGNASSSGNLSFRGTSPANINILNGDNFNLQTSVGGDVGLRPKLTVLNNGDVGIGTTLPGYLLQVGNAGDGTEARANAWNSLSDIRFKENITSLNPQDSLNKILQLDGVTFDWKSNGKESMGFIAQDVQKIFPELVSTDQNGYLSLNYGGFAAPIVNAIKEQQLQIATMSGNLVDLSSQKTQTTGTVSSLTNQIVSLSALNESLNTQVLDLQNKYASIAAELDKLSTQNPQNQNTNNPEASVSAALSALTSSVASSSGEVGSASATLAQGDQLLTGPTATISSLLVTDKASLYNVYISGELHNGLLTIDGVDNGIAAIDSLTEPLKLQNNALASITFENDSVTIDTYGNVTLAQGNLNLQKGRILGNDSMRGKIIIKAGQTSGTATMNWSSTPVSLQLTPSYNTKVWFTNLNEKGFTINTDTTSSKDQEVDWFAIW